MLDLLKAAQALRQHCTDWKKINVDTAHAVQNCMLRVTSTGNTACDQFSHYLVQHNYKAECSGWYCSIKPIGGPLWFFEHKVCLHKQMPVLKRKHLHILNWLDLFQITWWLWEQHGASGTLMFFNNIQMACPLLARFKCCPIPGPSGCGQGQVVFTAAQHMHAP